MKIFHFRVFLVLILAIVSVSLLVQRRLALPNGNDARKVPLHNQTLLLLEKYYRGSSIHLNVSSIRPEDYPKADALNHCEIRRPAVAPFRIVQISAKFGHIEQGSYKFQKHVLRHEAFMRSTGVFDEVHEYFRFPLFILRDARWTQYLQFLIDENHQTRRGGGYWFWKAVLLEHHLQELAAGDFLVYADNDVTQHPQFLEPLIHDMINKSHNIAMNQMVGWGHTHERRWDKRDVYEAYCPGRDLETDKTEQYDAMFMILRKDEGTTGFVAQLRAAVENYHTLSDEPSFLPNFAFFEDHRHDQTIINLLLKCRFGEPDKQIYAHACQWRTLQTMRLPAWTPEQVDAAETETAQTFARQECLMKRASKAARRHPRHRHWKWLSK